MKTQSVKASDIDKKWVVVDAANQVLGRLASQIAYVLRGKHKASFVPHLDCEDNVVVINADKIKLTGDKLNKKFYHRHSTYVGGLTSISAGDLLVKYPDRLITIAVKGMLPRGKLGRKVISNLKVYAGDTHTHLAQAPVAMPLRIPGRS